MVIVVIHLLKFPAVFSPLLSVFLREAPSANILMTSVSFSFWGLSLTLSFALNLSANLIAVSLVVCWEVCLVCGAILPCCFLKLSYPPVLSLGLSYVFCKLFVKSDALTKTQGWHDGIQRIALWLMVHECHKIVVTTIMIKMVTYSVCRWLFSVCATSSMWAQQDKSQL